MALDSFLANSQLFGRWEDAWSGVPLACGAFLSDELPPHEFIASVRAVVLRGEEVLLVPGSPPILSVGGRSEPGEALEGTLLREVGEECGWRVRTIAILGFVHFRHRDAQRPAWGRPAPDFLDPIFVAEAVAYEPGLLLPGEKPSHFVPVAEVERYGIEEINRTFLHEALRKRSVEA